MAAVGGSSAAATLPSLRHPPSSAAFRRSSPPPPPQVSIFSKPSLSRARVSARSLSLNLNPRCEVVSNNSVQKKGIGFKASPLPLSNCSSLPQLTDIQSNDLLTWSETPPTHSQPEFSPSFAPDISYSISGWANR